MRTSVCCKWGMIPDLWRSPGGKWGFRPVAGSIFVGPSLDGALIDFVWVIFICFFLCNSFLVELLLKAPYPFLQGTPFLLSPRFRSCWGIRKWMVNSNEWISGFLGLNFEMPLYAVCIYTSIHMYIHNMYYACILCIYIYIHVSMHTYSSSFDDVYLIYYETAGISKVPGSAAEIMKRDIREAIRNAMGGWQLILELPCFKIEEAWMEIGMIISLGFVGENLNRKPWIFPWSWGFPVNFPLNQPIDHWNVAEADVFSAFFLISPIRFPPLKEKFCYFFCISKTMTTSCTHPNITISLELELPELG